MTAVSASQIPDALKVVPRWLLWRLEDRNGKPSKTPYQSNGKLARVDDPTTWTTFEKALTAYQAGGFDGVGITLTDDDDLIGIDLDKCLNPETGELEPEAARIVAELPTYCEVSPSGRGLRLFGFGKLPQGGRRKGKIEMYESGRYLTVTGHRFNGHDTLADIAAEVVAVHARIFGKPAAPPSVKSKPSPSGSLDLDDAALLEKARSAKNGGDFERLWSGDTAGNGGDHSAADLALCSMLAFWANGETDRIDRLFRQSGLMRPKWDKPHFSDGRTYGAATVERAVATLREGYSGRKPEPRLQLQTPGHSPTMREGYSGRKPEPRARKWHGELIKDEGGKAVKVHYNAVLVAENAYPGLIGFNEFSGQIEARTPSPWRAEPGPWSDYDTQEFAFHIVKEPNYLPAFRLPMLETAVQTAARRHRFNPAQERLRALADQWDQKARLGSWLVDYLSVAPTDRNREYLREIGGAWLKGVAARVLFPGCKSDNVLTLIGPQGYRKSSAAAAIADCIVPNSFADSLPPLGSDEAANVLRGCTIAEFSDLAGLSRSDVETIKAFISRKSDRFREKYARYAEDHPRTVSFIATSNEDCGFLRDPSGNRRWWPVTLAGAIDIERLQEALPQLLGEAAKRVLDGELWHVTDKTALGQAEEIREEHSESDVWESAVLNSAARLRARERSINAILSDMGIEVARHDRAAQNRVSAILRANGYRRTRARMESGERAYLWEKLPQGGGEPVLQSVPIGSGGGQEGDSTLRSQQAACPSVPICPPQKENKKTNETHPPHPQRQASSESGEEKKSFIENEGDRGGQGGQIGTNLPETRRGRAFLSHQRRMEITPLAQRLAALAGLDAAKMVAGELSEADWPKITDASAELAQRHHEGRDAISALISRIDAAYNRAEVSP